VSDDATVTGGFDEGLRDLEEIVALLESGRLTLEDALQAFERGVGLIRRLHGQLDGAERRLEILSRGEDGRLRARPVENEEP
jgi:exodeoxyribonuclease VII small subunit